MLKFFKLSLTMLALVALLTCAGCGEGDTVGKKSGDTVNPALTDAQKTRQLQRENETAK